MYRILLITIVLASTGCATVSNRPPMQASLAARARNDWGIQDATTKNAMTAEVEFMISQTLP